MSKGKREGIYLGAKMDVQQALEACGGALQGFARRSPLSFGCHVSFSRVEAAPIL